jgi:hypothetical protein
VHGAPNRLLSDGLLGVPLGTHWLSGSGLVSVHEALFLAVFAALAGVCWLSARLGKRAAAPAASPAAARAASVGSGPAEPTAGGRTAGLLTGLLPT